MRRCRVHAGGGSVRQHRHRRRPQTPYTHRSLANINLAPSANVGSSKLIHVILTLSSASKKNNFLDLWTTNGLIFKIFGKSLLCNCNGLVDKLVTNLVEIDRFIFPNAAWYIIIKLFEIDISIKISKSIFFHNLILFIYCVTQESNKIFDIMLISRLCSHSKLSPTIQA